MMAVLCLFVCLYVCLFVYLIDYELVCLFDCLLFCLCVYWFVCLLFSFDCLFVCVLVCLFVLCLFVCCFVCFVGSHFARLFFCVCTCVGGCVGMWMRVSVWVWVISLSKMMINKLDFHENHQLHGTSAFGNFLMTKKNLFPLTFQKFQTSQIFRKPQKTRPTNF